MSIKCKSLHLKKFVGTFYIYSVAHCDSDFFVLFCFLHIPPAPKRFYFVHSLI